MTPIHIRWSDDGQHIRKWAHAPFDGSTEYTATPRAASGIVYVDGSIYQGMEASLVRDGTVIAHVVDYGVALEISKAMARVIAPTTDAPVTVEQIGQSIAKQLAHDPFYDRVILPRGQWDTLLAALASAPAAVGERTLALVIAAREFWDIHNDLSDESRALDKALEPFSGSVPYENEPASAPAGDGVPHGLGTSALTFEDDADGFAPVAILRGRCVYIQQGSAQITLSTDVADRLAAALDRPRAAVGGREAE